MFQLGKMRLESRFASVFFSSSGNVVGSEAVFRTHQWNRLLLVEKTKQSLEHILAAKQNILSPLPSINAREFISSSASLSSSTSRKLLISSSSSEVAGDKIGTSSWADRANRGFADGG